MFAKEVQSVTIAKPQGVQYIEKGRKLLAQDGKTETEVSVTSIRIKHGSVETRFSNGEIVTHDGFPFTAVRK